MALFSPWRWRGVNSVRQGPCARQERSPDYLSSMICASARRTTGIMTNIVGAAIAQAIIQELNHILNMVRSQPSTRQVATPVTRKVMKKVVPTGRAYL